MFNYEKKRESKRLIYISKKAENNQIMTKKS